MIVTCREGNVFRVHGDGPETLIAGPFGVNIEGPAVVPLGFGPHGGEMWVADEDSNAIHAVKNTNPPGPGPYTVFPNILSHVNAEGVYVIPNSPCTFTPLGCSQGNGDGAFFLAEQQMFQQVWKYPLSDFTGLGGNVILTSESGIAGADTSLVTSAGTTYVQTSFGPESPAQTRAPLSFTQATFRRLRLHLHLVRPSPTAATAQATAATFIQPLQRLRLLQPQRQQHLQQLQRLR